MKDLRTLLEASILDIENTLNMNIDINLLFSAKSQDQFNQYAQIANQVIGSGAFK